MLYRNNFELDSTCIAFKQRRIVFCIGRTRNSKSIYARNFLKKSIFYCTFYWCCNNVDSSDSESRLTEYGDPPQSEQQRFLRNMLLFQFRIVHIFCNSIETDSEVNVEIVKYKKLRNILIAAVPPQWKLQPIMLWWIRRTGQVFLQLNIFQNFLKVWIFHSINTVLLFSLFMTFVADSFLLFCTY